MMVPYQMLPAPEYEQARSATKLLPSTALLSAAAATAAATTSESGALPLIVVPFRDAGDGVRDGHLRALLQHAQQGGLPNNVLVVEQSADGRKFNRGALLNAGVRLAAGARAFLLHDVDLLPQGPVLPFYRVWPAQPLHLGRAWTSKYAHAAFFGGVLSISREHFEAVNGFLPDVWGWGGEDDVLRNRIALRGLQVWVPALEPQSGDAYLELPHPHQGKGASANSQKHSDVLRGLAPTPGYAEQRFTQVAVRAELALPSSAQQWWRHVVVHLEA